MPATLPSQICGNTGKHKEENKVSCFLDPSCCKRPLWIFRHPPLPAISFPSIWKLGMICPVSPFQSHFCITKTSIFTH